MGLEPYQIVRELVAGSLGLVNLYIFFSFAMRPFRFKNIWDDPGTQGTIVLMLYFFGVTVSRLWDWLVFGLTNLSIQFDWPKAEWLLWVARGTWVIVALSGALALWGGLLCAVVFNPNSVHKSLMAKIKEARVRLIVVSVMSIVVPLAVFLMHHGGL